MASLIPVAGNTSATCRFHYTTAGQYHVGCAHLSTTPVASGYTTASSTPRIPRPSLFCLSLLSFSPGCSEQIPAKKACLVCCLRPSSSSFSASPLLRCFPLVQTGKILLCLLSSPSPRELILNSWVCSSSSLVLFVCFFLVASSLVGSLPSSVFCSFALFSSALFLSLLPCLGFFLPFIAASKVQETRFVRFFGGDLLLLSASRSYLCCLPFSSLAIEELIYFDKIYGRKVYYTWKSGTGGTKLVCQGLCCRKTPIRFLRWGRQQRLVFVDKENERM